MGSPRKTEHRASHWGAQIAPEWTGRAAQRTVAQTVLALLAGGLCGALVACAPARDKTALAIDLPADVPGGLQLQWERVSGADGYRLVFMRMTGAALCTLRVDAQKQPAFQIRRDSLPAGLAHGWQLNVEVRAMRHGELMAAAGVRPLKMP